MSAERVKELEQALSSARTVIIGLATPLVGSMSPEIAARLDEWALLLKGAEPPLVFSPEAKRRALDLMKPDHGPALELEEVDAIRRKHRSGEQP